VALQGILIEHDAAMTFWRKVIKNFSHVLMIQVDPFHGEDFSSVRMMIISAQVYMSSAFF